MNPMQSRLIQSWRERYKIHQNKKVRSKYFYFLMHETEGTEEVRGKVKISSSILFLPVSKASFLNCRSHLFEDNDYYAAQQFPSKLHTPVYNTTAQTPKGQQQVPYTSPYFLRQFFPSIYVFVWLPKLSPIPHLVIYSLYTQP